MTPIIDEIKISEIIFDEVIYPRKEHDPVLVQRYVEVLEEIEAKQAFISVSADNKLLDGKHRWLAYRKREESNGGGDPTIKVHRYDVATPHEQLKLAARLNSSHGYQLSTSDKEQTAKSLYAYGMSYEEIASALSVGKKKVGDWLARTVKENKDKRNRRIFDLWMACYTQEEIAEVVRLSATDKALRISGNEFLKTENQKSAANHATDFDPPTYNIWKQQAKSEGPGHFGNSEIRWLDNLLYLYTDPFDIVVDPFGGGGSTIDLCRKRFRRYWVSDRKPIIEREGDIRQHDLIAEDGSVQLPSLPRWKDTRLVYLDPPYWKQAEGQYSKDPTDLANMPLEQFNTALAGIISGFARKLKNGAPSYIALIIQPTQWKAPDRHYTDHVGDMLRAVKLPVHMRFSVPYESQQCNAQMVEWAKTHKRCLVLTREIVVWEVA